MDLIHMGLLVIIGLVFGSFLGVVVDRVPRGVSIIRPASSCSRCGHRLGPLDLVPVLSYLAQRGRCRYCETRIPPRDLAIEGVTALVFLGVFALAPDWQGLVSGCLFGAFLIVMFLIDLEHMRLPNSVNGLGFIAALLVAALGWSDVGVIESIAGAAVGSGVVLLIVWLSKGGMGVGDAKFLGVIGAFLGPLGSIYTLFVASFVGAGIGLALIRLGKHGRRTPIPFGPFLALGAAMVWAVLVR